jgi:hypothetical protein
VRGFVTLPPHHAKQIDSEHGRIAAVCLHGFAEVLEVTHAGPRLLDEPCEYRLEAFGDDGSSAIHLVIPRLEHLIAESGESPGPALGETRLVSEEDVRLHALKGLREHHVAVPPRHWASLV